ncbi:RraA family protein [Afifella pfennigii]|uniref:RraA family protein n=1 Tax=Afifella pfennigii TaxID=209897 RepID=UPI000A008363|nr:hypothetical protein [Afifella pfennigii]
MAQKPKSAEMLPGPGFRIRKTIERPPAELVARYREFDTTDVSDQMNRMYTMSPDIHRMTLEKDRIVGTALTVKVFPGDNLMVHKALDVAQPGDVVVVDTSSSGNNAVVGDTIANKAMHRGIVAFIVDGLVRDITAVREVGLPMFARGFTPFGPLHRGPGELGYSVSCGGVVVDPGDIIVADDNGVVVVRKGFANEILDRLDANRVQMRDYLEDVKRGIFSNKWVDDQLGADKCHFDD